MHPNNENHFPFQVVYWGQRKELKIPVKSAGLACENKEEPEQPARCAYHRKDLDFHFSLQNVYYVFAQIIKIEQGLSDPDQAVWNYKLFLPHWLHNPFCGLSPAHAFSLSGKRDDILELRLQGLSWPLQYL